jgi:hypothetical protein
MTGRNKNTEVSALLDGEVRGERLEQLNEQLGSDAQLASEFAEQRSVKALLSRLPEYDTPDYMSTRVLGVIAERRSQKKAGLSFGLRMLSAGTAGFALCLLSVGGYMIASNSDRHAETQLADSRQDMVLPSGLTRNMDDVYKAQDWDNESLTNWRDMELSEEEKGKVDDRLEEFLQYAAQVHGYEVMVRSADATTADIPEAMLLMVGDEGGSE